MKKRFISILTVVFAIVFMALPLTACDDYVAPTGSASTDKNKTLQIADEMASNQATPTDIEYSLERYNLIRRAYWVNGQREKAITLPCEIVKPMGYVVLISGNTILGRFTVDGKVTSLNSYLTPDSEYYEYSAGEYSCKNKWLPDVDGSYGENDSGIFFFTIDGKYMEWSGDYLYSDIPFNVANPVISYEEVAN